MLHYKRAVPDDIGEMRRFIFDEGSSPHNHLPEQDVTEHLQGIATGSTEAVLATEDQELAGFATYVTGIIYPEYEAPENRANPHGYVAEVVVGRRFRCQGIATALLERAKRELARMGMATIYIKRHAENVASAGMMRNAGFVEVGTFDDPDIRAHGNRKTTVCRFGNKDAA